MLILKENYLENISKGGRVAVKHWASSRKVAKPWFNARCGSASLCPWKRHLNIIRFICSKKKRLFWWDGFFYPIRAI